LIVACSKSDTAGDKKGSGAAAAPSAAPAAVGSDASTETRRPPLPEFDVAARLEEIGNSYDDSFTFATKNGTEAAAKRCVGVEALYHPFCYEGIASAYQGHKGATPRAFEATMAKIDTTFALIDCQGLGFAAEDSPKLLSIAKDLATDQCRSGFWDGQGYYRALVAAGTSTAPCRKEEGKAPDLDACVKQGETLAKADLAAASCGASAEGAKPGARSAIPAGFELACSHGVGRALRFLLGADLPRAMAACSSKNPQFTEACISGTAFVTVIAFPDRLDVAFDALAAASAERKPAFARGMGRALSFRRAAKDWETWLGALSSAEQREAARLPEVYGKCTSYFQLDKCEWLSK
jgi:hypothetical protein